MDEQTTDTACSLAEELFLKLTEQTKDRYGVAAGLVIAASYLLGVALHSAPEEDDRKRLEAATIKAARNVLETLDANLLRRASEN